MKIYNVGPDELYDLPGEDDQKWEWLVFWYEDGGYDGSGEAVALCKEDNLLYIKNLSHCSCYGPMDGGMGSGDKVTIEDFVSHKDNIHIYDARMEIKDKVVELLASAHAPVFVEPFDFLKSL